MRPANGKKSSPRALTATGVPRSEVHAASTTSSASALSSNLSTSTSDGDNVPAGRTMNRIFLAGSILQSRRNPRPRLTRSYLAWATASAVSSRPKYSFSSSLNGLGHSANIKVLPP